MPWPPPWLHPSVCLYIFIRENRTFAGGIAYKHKSTKIITPFGTINIALRRRDYLYIQVQKIITPFGTITIAVRRRDYLYIQVKK